MPLAHSPRTRHTPVLLRHLQACARARGLSQRELARRTGLTPDTCARMMTQSDWRGLHSIETALRELDPELWARIWRHIVEHYTREPQGTDC